MLKFMFKSSLAFQIYYKTIYTFFFILRHKPETIFCLFMFPG